MIIYKRFFSTLKLRHISQYELVNKYGISKGLLDRLRKNEPLTTYSLDKICSILKCHIEDIVEYIPSDNF